MVEARIASLNVSNGGVPKRPVESAAVTAEGLAGDRQNDLRYHGGPHRAVSLFSLEVIERLRGEGHPIAVGTAGENVTLSGLDWTRVVPGVRFAFAGGVVLEVTAFASPCKKIVNSFRDLDSRRVSRKLHPGDSRVYARVVREGTLRTGDEVRVEGNGNGEGQ